MGKRVTAVSFGTDSVQIATVLSHGSGVTVERVLSLKLEELDAFLSVEPSKEYLVAINPSDTIYETLQIPPVENKIEGALIRAEAARQHPELGAFSCAYQIMGEVPSEGRIVRKVSCCNVSHETILPHLELFTRHNKVVKQLLVAPHVLATLVAPPQVEASQEPVLCAHDEGQSKTLFLLDGDSVVFSRSIASNGYGWDPIDRQHIAMTQDYCFQALRIQANRVLVLNSRQAEDSEQQSPRLERLKLPEQLSGLSPDSLMTALIPLTLAFRQLPDTCNLLPASYRSESFKQVLYTRSSTLFTATLLVLLLAAASQFYAISSLKETITNLSAGESHLTETVRQHQSLAAVQKNLQPLLTRWNETMAVADIPHTLVALDKRGAYTTTLKTLNLKRDKDSIYLQFSGNVSGNDFASTQERFEAYIAELQRIRGMQVTHKQLELQGRQFSIEAVYKP